MSGSSIVSGVIFFASFTLLISLIINNLKKKLRVPATIMMLISGILLRYVTKFLPSSLDAYELADHIDQNFLLFVFIPPLLFETALSLEWHIFKRQFFMILLLATTGVMISTLLIALAAALVYIDHSYSTSTFLIFGVVMSSTDHVSIVAQFKEHHVETSYPS
jgi:NhaP-type Na+/H+ or K+/H+ antiporter